MDAPRILERWNSKRRSAGFGVREFAQSTAADSAAIQRSVHRTGFESERRGGQSAGSVAHAPQGRGSAECAGTGGRYEVFQKVIPYDDESI
jgi:hypothetical protein